MFQSKYLIFFFVVVVQFIQTNHLIQKNVSLLLCMWPVSAQSLIILSRMAKSCPSNHLQSLLSFSQPFGGTFIWILIHFCQPLPNLLCLFYLCMGFFFLFACSQSCCFDLKITSNLCPLPSFKLLILVLSLSFSPPQLYEGLRPQDLRRLKDMLIVETADMLQAPLFTAEALLRAHGTMKHKHWHTCLWSNNSVQAPCMCK